MANRIRGLTIQINGETKGLNKALTEVNGQSKSLQKELKEVEKALRLDPGNTELLRQKQTLLAQSVDATRTKLDALRQAQEQMARANAANTRWEEAYEPLRVQIDETREALRRLTAQEDTMRTRLESGEISTEQYETFQRTLQDTTQRSRDLATELRQLEQQFEDGHISDEEYRRFQRELISTTNELEELERQAGRSNVALTRISDTCGKVGDKLVSVGGKMKAGLTVPLAAAGVAAFKMASDFNESVNKVSEVFQDNASGISEWSKTSLEKMGLAQGTALDMAASFGDLGTSMGQSSAEAAHQSKQLVQLSADMASFKNISVERAQGALTAVYTGETESLKMLGVVMTQANLQQYAMSHGYQKNIQDMTQLELVQLRYNYVLDATKNAQGDFERTNEGAANSTRILTETLKEVVASLGQELLPILVPIIQSLTNLLKGFNSLDDGTKAFIVRLLMLVATLGPVIVVIGSVFKAISSISSGIGALGAVAGIFTAGAGNATYITFVKWAGIIIAVVAAIALLVAGINVLIGKGDQMSNTVNNMGNAVNGFKGGTGTNLPAYASGTNFHPGGLALVGEQGAELLELPRGTRVYNNRDTSRILSGGGSSGGDTFIIEKIEVKSIQEIDDFMRLARDARRMERMGTVRG